MNKCTVVEKIKNNKMYHSFLKYRNRNKFICFKKFRNQLNVEIKNEKIQYKNYFLTIALTLKKYRVLHLT